MMIFVCGIDENGNKTNGAYGTFENAQVFGVVSDNFALQLDGTLVVLIGTNYHENYKIFEVNYGNKEDAQFALNLMTYWMARGDNVIRFPIIEKLPELKNSYRRVVTGGLQQ